MTPRPPSRVRTVRVRDALWAAAAAKAEARGETIADVIRRALTRYANSK